MFDSSDGECYICTDEWLSESANGTVSACPVRMNDPDKYTPMLAVAGVVITTAIVWSGRGIKQARQRDLSQAKTDAVSAVMGAVGLVREALALRTSPRTASSSTSSTGSAGTRHCSGWRC